MEKEVASDDAVVFFMANWCGPCNVLTRQAEGDVDYFNEKGMRSVCVDIEDIEGGIGMKSGYGVGAVPTVLVYSDGKLVDKMIGLDKYNSFKKRVCGE